MQNDVITSAQVETGAGFSTLANEAPAVNNGLFTVFLSSIHASDPMPALMAVISKSPALVETELIRVKKEGEKLTLISTNLETFALVFYNVILAETAGPDFDFLTDPKGLVSIHKDRKIQIQYNKEGQPKAAGTGARTFEVYNLGEGFKTTFPELPELDQAPVKNTFDTKALIFALSLATKDEMRPAMTGISLGANICSSDGHRLLRIPGADFQRSDLPKPITGTMGLVLPPVKYLAKIKGPVNIGFCKKTNTDYNSAWYINIETQDKSQFYMRAINQSYPDFNAVIPLNNANTLGLNTKELAQAINEVLPAANRTTSQIRLSRPAGSDTLEIYTMDLDFNSEARVKIPLAPGSSFEGAVYFSGKFLLSMLKGFPDPDIKFEISVPTKPVIFKGGPDNWLFLLMPYYRDPGAKW